MTTLISTKYRYLVNNLDYNYNCLPIKAYNEKGNLKVTWMVKWIPTEICFSYLQLSTISNNFKGTERIRYRLISSTR